MDMYNVVFIVIVFVFVLPLLRYLKARDLGLDKRESVLVMFLFPIVILKTYLYIIKDVKNTGIKKMFKLLLEPITNISGIITRYCKSILLIDAKSEVLKDLVPKLSKKEFNKLKCILKEEGCKIDIDQFLPIRIRMERCNYKIGEVERYKSNYSVKEKKVPRVQYRNIKNELVSLDVEDYSYHNRREYLRRIRKITLKRMNILIISNIILKTDIRSIEAFSKKGYIKN